MLLAGPGLCMPSPNLQPQLDPLSLRTPLQRLRACTSPSHHFRVMLHDYCHHAGNGVLPRTTRQLTRCSARWPLVEKSVSKHRRQR